MEKPLKVLLLEDREDDALLIVRALRQSGFQVTYERVETEPEFRRRLTDQVDLILSDYSLPQINGLKALEIVQELELDIPFIIITGTLEEMALECMRRGAADSARLQQSRMLSSAAIGAPSRRGRSRSAWRRLVPSRWIWRA